MGRQSRFTPAQKRDAVLAVLTKKTVSEVCRELQVSETSFTRWRAQALEAIDEAMRDKADRVEPYADLERRLAEAERTIGKLALENECWESVEVADVRTRTVLGRR
jgi:transposase-like protein